MESPKESPTPSKIQISLFTYACRLDATFYYEFVNYSVNSQNFSKMA